MCEAWSEVLLTEEHRATGPQARPLGKPLAVTAGPAKAGRPIVLGSVVTWTADPEVSNIADGVIEVRGIAAAGVYQVRIDSYAATRRVIAMEFQLCPIPKPRSNYGN